MCNEFFKPTWKKVIGFLIVNSTALLAYLLFKLVFIDGGINKFLAYFYLVLAPFGFLMNLLASVLPTTKINTGVVVALSILQNILEIAWYYALACFIIKGYCIIWGKKATIIKPIRKRKK